MARLPMVDQACPEMLQHLACELPSFYMEDFSVIGFRVSDLSGAVRHLTEQHIGLVVTSRGTEVVVHSAAQIRQVIEQLAAAGIGCEITDLVDAVYQG